MYQITDSILKSGVYSALTEPTREFQQRISFGEGIGERFIKQISFVKGITKVEISQEGNSDGDGIVFGSCCASSCDAEFYNPDKTYNYAGKTMFVECGVKYPVEISYKNTAGGYRLTSNGKWVDSESIYSKVTDLIPVFEGDSFLYTGRGESGSASVIWYDGNKNFISAEEYSDENTRDHSTTVTVEAPEGAMWVMFQSHDYDDDVTLEVAKLNDSFFYIPCGYYKVEKPETDDDWRTVKITAYDAADDMTEPWNTNVSFPSNAYALLENTVEKHNLVLDVESDVLGELQRREITQEEAQILTAYSEREVCGFLCGLVAANARINTVGKFSVSRYQYFPAEEFTIIPEVQWQNGFTKTAEEEFMIHSVTSGVDDKVFTAGTGSGISFINPIITESEIYNLYDMYSGLSFQPSSCEWRGNPCIECGDTVYVRDKNGNAYTVFVASQEIDLTGGLSMQTNCPGGDAEISFDTVDERTRKALNKQYTALQQAIVDASNAINGALGGHYEILDSDNDRNPDGWLIKQYQDGTGGLIRANYAGIGLSIDGGKTYRTAIGYDGINADCITTGKLKADLIDTSTLVVSKNNVDGLNTELHTLLDAAEEADKKASNAQTTADSAKNALVNLCTDNNMTLVDGAKIYTGSIAANSIDVNTLSVGTGVAINRFYNDEFYNGDRGWYSYGGGLYSQLSETNSAYMQLRPSGSGMSVIMQKMYLVQGQRYSLSAQINPVFWSKNESTVYIEPFYGSSKTLPGQDLSEGYRYKGETVVKMVFDYPDATGFVDVGIAFRGLMETSTTASPVNIAWMSFSDAPNDVVGFYCTRKEWLASDYKESNYIGGTVHYDTTAEAYLTQKAFTVDSSGNLVTLGTIKSNIGEIGSMTYNPDRMDITTHSYYKYGTLPAFISSRISFINPLKYAEFSTTSGYGGINSAEDSKDWSARIEVASSGGVEGLEGNEYTMITSSGVSVNNGSSHSALTASGVEVDGVLVTSRESSKKKITEKSKVLSAFKNSRIYEYKMKYDDEKARAKTGFVIERETPEDVLSDDGKHINLYSMASMNWKATQEILERLEAVEKAVKTNA